jgi:acetyl-CoA C-acetyltransferase
LTGNAAAAEGGAFAAQAVMSGTQDIVIAAGAESVTRAPMCSPTSP